MIKSLRLLLGAGGLLGEEDGLDVGQDAALGDSNAGQQLVQLLVVPDGELEVPRDDPGLRALPEEPVDPAHGELEPRPAGPGLRLALHLAALATSRHLAEG